MKKAILAFSAILAIAAGCSRENFSKEFSNSDKAAGIKTIKAYTCETTKANLDFDNCQILWSPGDGEEIAPDAISVLTDTPNFSGENNVKYSYAGTEPSAEGIFIVDDEEGAFDTTAYFAVYPYSSSNAIVQDGKGKKEDIVKVMYSASQTLNEMGAAEKNNLMIAKGIKNEEGVPQLYFRNICSYILLQVEPSVELEGETIQAVVIKSTDGKVINGPAEVHFDVDGAITSVEFAGNGNNSTVVYLNGIEFDTPFLVAVPPTIDGGLSVSVITSSGLEMTKTSDFKIGMNQIVTMPPFQFEADAEDAAEIVGGETYPTVALALEEAKGMGTCTVKLLKDSYLGVPVEISNDGTIITLDLNGKTLREVGADIVIAADGNLVIDDFSSGKNGVIEQSDADIPAIQSQGNLTLNGGVICGGVGTAVTVTNGVFEMNGGELTNKYLSDSKAQATLIVYPTGDQVVDSVKLNAGKITTDQSRGVYVRGGCDAVTIGEGFSVTAYKSCIYPTDGKVTLAGGVYRSLSTNVLYAPNQSSTIIVKGGYYAKTEGYATISASKGKVSIESGYFQENISTYLAEGCIMEKCEVTGPDGLGYTYHVIPKAQYEAVLRIGEHGIDSTYANVTDALKDAALQDDGTHPCYLTLLSSCSVSEPIVLGGKCNLTIDFAGKTLVVNNTNRIDLASSEAGVTFNDSVGGGGVEQKKGNLLRADGGTVTINAGSFTIPSGSSAICMYTDASNGASPVLNINGGTISGGTYRGVYIQTGLVNITGGTLLCDNNTLELNSAGNMPAALYVTTSTKVTIDAGEKEVVLTSLGSNSTGDTIVVKSGVFKEPTVIGTKSTNGESVISGGKFDDLNLKPIGTSAVIKVEGGEFANDNATPCLIDSTGTVQITGGTFSSKKNSALRVANGTTKISGGKFVSEYQYGTIRPYTYKGISTLSKLFISGDAEIIANENSDKNSKAINIGLNGTSTGSKVTISGGKLVAPQMALKCMYGSVSIEGGTFIATDSCAVAVSTSFADAYISGGNFRSSYDGPIIVTETSESVPVNSLEGHVSGGWYDRKIADNLPAFGMTCQEGTKVEDDFTYTWTVDVSADAPDVVEINGTPCKVLDEAALALITDAQEDVTVKMLENYDISAQVVDLTNKNGKEVTLDLNNKILGVQVTTSGVLHLRDNSVEGGGVLTNGLANVITINAGGKVDVTSGTYKSTADGKIYVFKIAGGAEDQIPNTTLDISGTTKVESTARIAHLGYCTANIAGGTFTSTSFAFYPAKGCNITFGSEDTEGPSVKTASYVIESGTSASVSNIRVVSGYFYSSSTKANPFYGDNSTASTADNYRKKIKVAGGYWNKTVLEENFYNSSKTTGQKVSVTHTHDGEELTYTYKVSTATE